MRVIFLGPPGSGKGTQAARLAQQLRLATLSTGDMLRAAVASGSALGQKVQAIMERGDLVSDAIMIDLIRERLQAEDCAQGFILDGFPRTVAQAQALDALLQSEGTPLEKVVEFRVDDAMLVERICGRFACAQCGMGYHDTFQKPQQEGVCDRCGSHEFTRRKDDNAQTVTRRLQAYHSQTAPLLPYYRAQGLLVSIDGMQDIDAVFSDLVRVCAQ